MAPRYHERVPRLDTGMRSDYFWPYRVSPDLDPLRVSYKAHN